MVKYTHINFGTNRYEIEGVETINNLKKKIKIK